MSTVNPVVFYFLSRPSASAARQYIAIAYQTATERDMYPRAVLIRSGIHATTTINGQYQKDPKGEHLTLCFKDQEMLDKSTHVASHGYVDSKTDSNIREATHTPEKPDATVKKQSGRLVWPATESLRVKMEVSFGHLPDDAELKSVTGEE